MTANHVYCILNCLLFACNSCRADVLLKLQGVLEGFERCWERRKKIMEFERKKQKVKVCLYVAMCREIAPRHHASNFAAQELKAKIALLKAKTAAIRSQCSREKHVEEVIEVLVQQLMLRRRG